MAKATWQTYSQAFKSVVNFGNMFSLNITLPIPPITLALFVSHLYASRYAPSTICTYISSLGFLHKMQGFSDPTKSFLLQKALQGAQKLKPQIDTRLPITWPILNRLVNATSYCIGSLYKQQMFKSMLLLAFAAFLRVGEMTVSNKNVQNVLKLENIQWEQSKGIKVIFKNYKHSKGRTHMLHIANKKQGLCSVTALKGYIKMRGSTPGCLYIDIAGKPITRTEFTQMLHAVLSFCKLDPSVYKSHSLRIGAACQATAKGFSDAQIREMGRWKSDAFKKYIRL